ncbi:uncharacterized protein SCDLUD_003801, partial [Saccharomycodes ludwigii]
MMFIIYKRAILLLTFFIYLFAKIIDAQELPDTNDACSPITDPINGFKVRWYNYTYNDGTTFSNLDYMAYGYYQNSAPYHFQNGVSTVTFATGYPCYYNESDLADYFICKTAHYFLNPGVSYPWTCPDADAPYNSYISPETGDYTFTLGNVDDSAGVLFGDNAFGCCEQNDITATSTDFFLNAIRGWYSGVDGDSSSEKTLFGGLYYPLRIVFTNALGKANMNFTVTLPDGTVMSDFTNYVFTFDGKESYCPAYEHNTTTYTPWTGAFTSTIGTSVTTSIGSDGIPTTSTIYTVETPEVDAVTTTYIPWTGFVTSTIGNSIITTTGSDGISTTFTIYTVQTPMIPADSTTYEAWTGSVTTTVGTSIFTTTGTDGVPTTSTIYTVQTPTNNGVTTTNVPW